MRFGFNEDYAAHLAALDQALHLKVDVARLGILWPYLVNNGSGMWAYDDFCELLIPKGVKPLVTVALGAQQVDVGQYATLVETMYNKHNKAIFQILNEPNNPDFGELPDGYVRELCQETKRRLPNATLVGPSYSPVGDYQAKIENVYKDVNLPVGLNIYPRKDAVKTVIAELEFARQFHQDVWVTELGMGKEFFPNGQVDASLKAYRELNKRNVKSCIFHRLLEPANLDPESWEVRQRLWFVDKWLNELRLYNAFESERL